MNTVVYLTRHGQTEWNIDFIMKGDVNLCAPNGETLGCVRTRISETMDKLIEQLNGSAQNAVIMS